MAGSQSGNKDSEVDKVGNDLDGENDERYEGKRTRRGRPPNAERMVDQLLVNKLGLGEKRRVKWARVIGGVKKVIVAGLESWETKQEVMRNKSKLVGSAIFIDNDLTKKEREIQRNLVEMAKKEVRKVRNQWSNSEGGVDRAGEKGQGGRVLFWNVAGIMNKDKEFWEFVRNFDGLGRELKIEEEMIEVEGVVKRKMRMGKDTWTVLTVYNGEGMKEIGEKLDRMVSEEEERGILLIGGDFNARIGTEGEIYDGEQEEGRKSKDGTKNAEGEQLLRLTEERGWHIANGNIEGDEKGECTYVGAKGATVIDYVLMNTAGLSKIRRFEVEERTESDHLPLSVQCEIDGIYRRKKEKEVSTREVINWSKEKIVEFKERTKTKKFTKERLEDSWKELHEGTRGCMAREIIRQRKRVIREKFWWDKECTREKRKVKKLYTRWKRGAIERREYLEGKVDLKKLCKEKEERKRKEEMEQIRNAKTEAEIWKYINKGTKKRVPIGEKIMNEEWRKHFCELLGEKEEKTEAIKRKLLNEEEDEEELKDIEIERQIRLLKRKKIAGQDGIPSEAWKFCKGATREKLKEIMKRV
ncbi:hypothetical protein M0802_015130 [Mischocyttarus mexicanus]|nr:hypothetical protein M0802_015130 [Mischocyttarus mexicanus]